MDRKNWYFDQTVLEEEMDAADEAAEVADRALVHDFGMSGVLFGGAVAQSAPPAISCAVAGPAGIYDKLGQRVFIASNQAVDLSLDHLGVSTAVAGGGNSKILSVFAKFTRNLQNPKTDGDGNTVYFDEFESFELIVVQGAEAAVPTPPAVLADGILLADITRAFGATQILNADISITRREDLIVTSNGAISVRRGRVKDAFTDVVAALGQHVAASAYRHPATAIDYASGPAWFDAATNPATTVELQLDKLVTDLTGSAGGSGMHKIGCGSRTTWLGGRTNPGGVSGFAAVDKVITDLSDATGGDDGAERIGAAAAGNLAAGSVRSQLNELDTEKGGLATANAWTNTNSYSALSTFTADRLIQNTTFAGTTNTREQRAAVGISGTAGPTLIFADTLGALAEGEVATADVLLTCVRDPGVNGGTNGYIVRYLCQWSRETGGAGIFSSQQKCEETGQTTLECSLAATSAASVPRITVTGLAAGDKIVHAIVNITRFPAG